MPKGLSMFSIPKSFDIFFEFSHLVFTVYISFILSRFLLKNEAGLNCTSYNPSSFLYMNLNFFPLFIRVRYILPKKMLQNIFLRNLSFFAWGKAIFCSFIYYVMSNFVEYKIVLAIHLAIML